MRNCVTFRELDLEIFLLKKFINTSDSILEVGIGTGDLAAHYSNGILKNKGYKDDDNQFHGHWSYYDRDGELESDRYYFHGEPDGDWYSYHHDNKDNIIHHDYIKGTGVWEEFYNRIDKESKVYNNISINISTATPVPPPVISFS